MNPVKQQKCFWTAEEIDISRDHNDWDKLKDGEKFYLIFLGFINIFRN